MKDHYVYYEEYNVESALKRNTISKRISFDAIAYIENRTIGNNTTREQSNLTIILLSGYEVKLPMYLGHEFIEKFDAYKASKEKLEVSNAY